MGVAEGGVGDGDLILLAQQPGELGRADVEQQLPGAGRGGHGEVDVGQLGGRLDGDRCGPVRLVDGHIGQVAEQLAATVTRGPCGQQLGVGLDERGGQAPGHEVRVLEHGLQEGDVGGDATDPELRHRPAGLLDSLVEGASPTGELGQHRVEVGAHLSTRVRRTTVDAYATAAGGAVGGDHTGVGTEPVGRVLGGDAALQRCAAQHDALLGESEVGQRLARRDPHLRLHQVDVGDLLGHGVLDLDPGVHLDEHVVAVRVQEELHGAGVAVADLASEPHGVVAHLLAQRGVEVGCGGDLDDLLVTSLHRAVAFVEVDHPVLAALAVGKDLDLDVSGLDDSLLDEDGGVAEGRLALTHADLDGFPQQRRVVHASHATTAAAGDRLDEERIGHLGGRGDQCVHVGSRLDAGQRRDAGCLGRGDRAGLVSGQGEDVGARADEGDAGVGACFGEGGVLGEEAVARVDRVGSGPDRHLDDGVGVEVGPYRVAAFADLIRLIGLEPVLGPAVLIGKHRHRARTDLERCSEGPDGDLAPVGHQYLGEHGRQATDVRVACGLRVRPPVASASVELGVSRR